MIFFYSQNTVPKEILINQKLKNISLLEKLLGKNTNHQIKIKVPLKGKKKALLEIVENNVDAILDKKVSAKKKENLIFIEIKNKLKLKRIPRRNRNL